MGGGYTITDGKLEVGAMMSTEMACAEPLMAQDQWISAFVDGATVTLEADTLTLAKGGITITATDKEVARPDLPVEGTVWVVESLVSNQAVSSMPAGVEASLVFAGGKVAVDAGCNKGNGAAEIGDSTITFGPIATTKMFCEGAAGEVEQQVLGALTGEVAYTVDANALQLRGAGGGLDLRARP
jgi:heat shock protein HslJ